MIKNVLYVPGLKRNLLSIGKLTDAGNIFVFTSDTYLVVDKNDPHSIILHVSRDRSNNLYCLSTVPSRLSPALETLISEFIPPESSDSSPSIPMVPTEATPSPHGDSLDLWHKRLAHVHHQPIYHMSSHHLTLGLPIVKWEKSQRCTTCICVKQHRKHAPKHVVKKST